MLRDILSITADEAREYCQASDDEPESLFNLLIDSAIQAAETYLNYDFSSYGSGSGEGTGPLASIKLGCLMCVARWFEWRADGEKQRSIGNESASLDAVPEEAKRLWRASGLKRYPGF